VREVPSEEELPEFLQAFARRQAPTPIVRQWLNNVEHLAESLCKVRVGALAYRQRTFSVIS